ncbi:MAG: hypothetical protein AAFY28_05505, partial [Actinomycetota bacterium]
RGEHASSRLDLSLFDRPQRHPCHAEIEPIDTAPTISAVPKLRLNRRRGVPLRPVEQRQVES